MELHKQHTELVRLRQAEEARERAESMEGKRLRALADSLVCEYMACPLVLLLLLFSLGDTSLFDSCCGLETGGGCCFGVWSSSRRRGCCGGCCCCSRGRLRPGFYSSGPCS